MDNQQLMVQDAQEKEIRILQLKSDADFAMTPIGQQVKQFEATMRIAKMYAASCFIPDSYKFSGTGNNKQPLDAQSVIANCTIALEMATRMQANPLMVMQNLYIVHGQPAFSSKFLIACINASKRFSPLRYEFKGEEGTENYGCRAIAYEVNDTKHKDPLYGDWITINMANKEGWTKKTGSKWLTMPSQMLRYRAAAFWQRVYCPEISMGLITSEEVNDTFDDKYEEIKPAQQSARQTAQIPRDELGRPSLTALAEQAQQTEVERKNVEREQVETRNQDEPIQVDVEIEGQREKFSPKRVSKNDWNVSKSFDKNALLIYKVGLLYELYNEDADTAAFILNTTSKDCDGDFDKVLSFPKSKLKENIEKFKQANLEIYVCDGGIELKK